MRISTQMMYQQSMQNITTSQSNWLRYGEQLSTGKRVIRPSDDPIAAAQAVVISKAQSVNSQFQLARTFATQKVSLEESVLSQVTSLLHTAQEKVVYAGNDTLSDDDRASVATQLQGLRDQLLNLANSTDGNSRYIFAGYMTDQPPFVDSGSGVTYQGGTQNISQQVDAARTMVIGHTGNSVFDRITANAVPEPDGSPSETNLFEMLDSTIAALNTPAENLSETDKQLLRDVLDKTSRGLKNSLNNVLTVRAELGTQLSELDNLNALGVERSIGQSAQMSELIEVDWTSAISSYVKQQAALQASYKAFSDMQGMSLFALNR